MESPGDWRWHALYRPHNSSTLLRLPQEPSCTDCFQNFIGCQPRHTETAHSWGQEGQRSGERARALPIVRNASGSGTRQRSGDSLTVPYLRIDQAPNRSRRLQGDQPSSLHVQNLRQTRTCNWDCPACHAEVAVLTRRNPDLQNRFFPTSMAGHESTESLGLCLRPAKLPRQGGRAQARGHEGVALSAEGPGGGGMYVSRANALVSVGENAAQMVSWW